MSITIDVPSGDPTGVLGYAIRFNSEPAPVVTSVISIHPAGSAAGNTVLPTGFALYLPFVASTSTRVNVPDLVERVNVPYPSAAIAATPRPPLQNIAALSPIADETYAFTANGGGTIYLPITRDLYAEFDINPFIAALAAPASPSAEPTNPSTSSTGATARSSTTPAAQTSAPATAQSSTQAVTETSSSTPTSGGGGNSGGTSGGYSAGALAGGIVGAFLAAMVLCALLWFVFIRRRRSRRSAPQQRYSDSSNDYALADMARIPEKSQPVVAASAVTGWQKHLPQEKDDGTITKLFKSIFEQTQMHMEGYYVSNPQDLSDASIATLRELLEDDLPLMLPQTQKQVLLLEGILLRFMIRRVSGRSDVQDSFLPGDLSRIVKNNGWYMERESGQSGIATSGKKRGFSQALAQWRQLTGFLLPNHRDDQAYQNELRTKIEAAVQNIDSAYSPWQTSGKSSDKRRESLRGLLQQVSDAGILLFTQPSTFLFDWSTPTQSDSRTVAISPALLRENEGSSREDVLIKGSQGKL